jgi:hypothetical protein
LVIGSIGFIMPDGNCLFRGRLGRVVFVPAAPRLSSTAGNYGNLECSSFSESVSWLFLVLPIFRPAQAG